MNVLILRSIILATLLLALFVVAAYAEYDPSEGYDENTELRVKGTVIEILPRMRGPVVLVLKTAHREIKVITGPAWYMDEAGLELKPGTRLVVTGSKFIARDGTFYLIARQIKDLNSGREMLLRDDSLIPLWRGHHMMKGRGLNPL